MQNNAPILFYDAGCPFCKRMILKLSAITKGKELYFAPLQGSTAKKLLKVSSMRSVLFLDQKKDKVYKRSKAIFSALEVKYSWLKWIIPIAFLFDPFYVLIADLRVRVRKEDEAALTGPYFLS